MQQNADGFTPRKNDTPVLFALVHILGMKNAEMVLIES